MKKSYIVLASYSISSQYGFSTPVSDVFCGIIHSNNQEDALAKAQKAICIPTEHRHRVNIVENVTYKVVDMDSISVIS